MAQLVYALVTIGELKTRLVVEGPRMDAALQEAVNRASGDIEEDLDRRLVFRSTDPMVEYNTPEKPDAELYLAEWPLVDVVKVCEDISFPRTYGAATELALGTDYEIVNEPVPFLRRLQWGAPFPWACGPRTVQVTYKAGYPTTADVPPHIKGVCLDLASLYYREVERQQQGISSRTDASGNYTRFGPAMLTDAMREKLADERRAPWAMGWER